MPPRYIAAYDTERKGTCLAACRRIRDVHERFNFPATFFIVGQRLEEEGNDYRTVLGELSFFEIASHTYSHGLLKDHPFRKSGLNSEEIKKQIYLGKEIIEQTFSRPCLGLRPGYGYSEGLRGESWLLDQIVSAGYQYVSSVLWGPQTTMPALLESPFTYSADGYPDLWEFPGHGWHENLLKAHNLTIQPQRIVAWPLLFPELLPQGPIESPLDEFNMNRILIDLAIKKDVPYVSFIWHPWSLNQFDPEMKMLELTFAYIRDRGLEPATFAQEWSRLSGRSEYSLPKE